MKHLHRMYPLWILSLGFLIYGCAGKPVEMIDKTEKAMQEAKAEHADFFAKDEWNAAEQASAQAGSLLDQQKWAEANTALLNAMSRYNKAKALAKDGKEAFIKGVQQDRQTIEIRYKKLKDSIAAAKLSPAQRKSFDEACKEIDDSIAKITTQLDQGQFSEAKTQAARTVRRIWEVEQDLPGKAAAKKS